MNRRLLQLAVGIAALVGDCGFVAGAAGAENNRRPNILFAFADDWGRHASAYARIDKDGGMNDLVRTPNFDRIAARGVLFRNALANAPSCTPCRSSILAGQYFWRTGRGAILRGARWDPTIPSWPLLLKDSGYHIGKTWKVWSPGVPADAPYGRQAYAYQKSGSRFNRFSQNVSGLVAAGKPLDAARRELLEEVRGNFTAFLADQKESQPFCYWFGPTNVHRTWTRGSGKALWNIDPDELKGKLPPFLPDVPEVREDLADYFGEIAAFDAALGVLIEELKKAGALDNTLIVVSGDHGAPGFPHGKCNLYDFGTRVPLAIAGPGVRGGRVVDDFVNLPDLAPTFLEVGGVHVPDVMTARSLRPVLKSDREGLVDPQRTWAVTGRERHVEMARAGNLPYPQRAIRTADFLLVVNFHPERYPLGDPYHLDGDRPPSARELANSTFVTIPDEDAGPTKAFLVQNRNHPTWKRYFDHAYGRRPREELFDLKKDPHQMHNVAADPAYAEVIAKLRKQLMDELQRTGDPRLVDGGKFFETPPLAGPLPDDVPKPNRKRRKQNAK
jgi:arylsulfatase A-like enzyme